MHTEQTPGAPVEPELAPEIAHLLLIDIVGYSRLLVNEQIAQVEELKKIVRSCSSFRAAEAADKLVRLPTGDGMALLFFGNPEEPLRCALEISRALKEKPDLQVRMGAHSGPVNRVTDVNDRSNIAGAGINVAQRVMDCGDAGHILLSKRLADDLTDYRHWSPYFHDLGECEVKHGLRLHLVNLFKDGLGNEKVPEKLRRGGGWRKALHKDQVRAVRPSRWPLVATALAIILALATVAISAWVLTRHRSPSAPVRAVEKSIAVLPFENLSDEKKDAFFTDGIQDEILTDLAKLADLKVISRTSVMQYRGQANRNLREIGSSLGVTYALEGSVQRNGDRVRVTAQLIDARTDAHVWADHYDRALADVFAIQSEVAEKIVEQLKLKISPSEKAAIEERPTSDLLAFDYYVRAKDLIERSVFNAPRDEQLVEAIDLLGQAIARDPSFARAYYLLAHAHDQIYFIGTDHTPERLALAEHALQKLQEVRPGSPDVHLAEAKHLYWCYRDYDKARREIAEIGDRLPNDPWPLLILGYMDRRQGRWDESTRNLEHALALDPRNSSIIEQMSITYEYLRRYPEAIALVDRALSIKPDQPATLVGRSFLEMARVGQIKPLRVAIDDVLSRRPQDASIIASEWLTLAAREHNPTEARRALAVLPPDGCRNETLLFPRGWCEGRVAQLAGDQASAQKSFLEARQAAKKIAREQPGYWEAVCILGVLDAVIGHKDDAISEGKRAVEMIPLEKDSLSGARAIYYLAIIYTLVGENNLALQQLERSAQIPCGVSYDDLLFEPQWDNLRPDPRFAKIIASLAPKN